VESDEESRPVSQSPFVSVVVTTYNQEKYICETLESVFAQTYPHYEVIVVDDGSTDGTAAAVRSFGTRLRYVYQDNQGVAGARNTGVAQARGELIALLDGDDLWHPEKLRVQVEAFLKHPDAGLVAVDIEQFDENRIMWPSLLTAVLEPDSVFRADEIVTASLYQELLRGNRIGTTSSVMIPAEVLRHVGPSDKRFPVSSDYDLYLRIARRFDITLVRQVLTRWRYLPTSASGPASQRRWRWGLEVVRILVTQARAAAGAERRELYSAAHNAATKLAEAVYYLEPDNSYGTTVRRLFTLVRLTPGAVGPRTYLPRSLVPGPVRRFAEPLLSALRARG
jgi:glycosyltransferase involved in cell wall biosynthesis